MTAVHSRPTAPGPAGPFRRSAAAVSSGAMEAVRAGRPVGSESAVGGRPGPGAAHAVPLRVLPSRRSPGPLVDALRLVEPGDPTTGRLVVDASHSALSPHLARGPVNVTVDGTRHECSWGRTAIDLPPGRHHVEVEAAHGWGRVVEAVPVAAGHVVGVFYRAPTLPGAVGALGPVPHRGAARGAVLGLLTGLTTLVAAVLMLLALVGAVAAG